MLPLGLSGHIQHAGRVSLPRRCQRVPCTPDAISTPTTSYSPAVERPIRKQQVSSPISQLAAVQEPPVVWPSQQAPQIERVTHIRPPQQQYAQDTLQQAAVLSSPLAGHSKGSASPSSSALDTTASADTTTTFNTPRKQHRKRHKHYSHTEESSRTQQPGSLLLVPAARQAPLKFAPCGKRDGQQHAASVSKQLRRGKQVLLPAGAGMQLVRTTAMLSSARSLLLSHNSSTGLVFQPSFSTAAGAAAMQALQQQKEQQHAARSSPVSLQQQLQHAFGSIASAERATSSSGTSTSHRTSSTNPKGSSKGVMLLVSAVSEAQLRRFDQDPLIAARSTRAAALAAAIFARLCKRGYSSVRAAGPEATRLAMLGAAEARSKLLGCGLDLAVVPTTELVDVDSLGGPEGAASQYVEMEGAEGSQEGVGPGEELPKQFVWVTVLHLVRCEPQQPGRLLPWPVPAEQLPAVRHAQQQQEQGQQQWLLPQQWPAQQMQAGEPQQSELQQQQQPAEWGSGLLAAAQQAQQQQPPGPAGQQERQSEPCAAPLDLTPLLVASNGSSSRRRMGNNGYSVGYQRDAVQNFTTLPANGGSSSSSSVQSQAVVPSPLLLPPPHPDTAVGWSGATSGLDTSQLDSSCPEQLLLDADQLQVLQLQQRDMSGVPSAAGLGAGAPASPSQGSGSIVCQPGGLLLQHKQAHSKKGSRQLVAAAQAGSGTASRGSSS